MTVIHLATLLLAGAMAQDAPPAETAAPAAAEAPAPTIVLRADTPVELMATKEISTATASAGTRFKLRLNRAIDLGGGKSIPVGATAYGEVVAARGSGGLGRSGEMTARLLHLQFGEAEIPLDGKVDAKGQGAGSAAVAVVLSGWIGLFHRGNNAKIKAGEIISAFVAEDVTLDMAGTPRRVTAPTAPTT